MGMLFFCILNASASNRCVLFYREMAEAAKVDLLDAHQLQEIEGIFLSQKRDASTAEKKRLKSISIPASKACPTKYNQTFGR